LRDTRDRFVCFFAIAFGVDALADPSRDNTPTRVCSWLLKLP
jgi:hypothetical protein